MTTTKITKHTTHQIELSGSGEVDKSGPTIGELCDAIEALKEEQYPMSAIVHVDVEYRTFADGHEEFTITLGVEA